MVSNFEILLRGEGLSRIGRIKTKHGDIITPTLLPVINPKVSLITPKDIKKLGFDAIITNSYIIYRDQALKEIALNKGIHNLLGFHGPIMTDSGTFQSYVYGNIHVTNLEIVKFQHDIGVDIGTILDVFTLPDDPYDVVKRKIEDTISRAKESLKFKEGIMLSYPIQGGIYTDLREYAAREGKHLNFDLYPIGGVVPLMESQRYVELVRIIIHSKIGLGPSKPVHLFGCGHPLLFPIAVLLGIDLFDSASYAKYARDNRILTPTGTLKLENIEEFTYPSPYIDDYTPKELLKMDPKERERLLSLHNLYVVSYEIRRVREAVRRGELWELVEMRARAHPKLLSALRVLKEYVHYLEKFEPISLERAFFYTSPESLNRPSVYRLRRRLLERFRGKYNKITIIDVKSKPYMDHVRKVPKGCDVFVRSIFGPVPLLWDIVYPIAQSEEPEIWDPELERFVKSAEEEVCARFQCAPLDDLVSIDVVYSEIDRLKAIADYQFGPPAGEILFRGNISIERSKTTGRVRMIYKNSLPILFLRPNDGLYTLKYPGGYLLHRLLPEPKMYVIVTRDSAEYNAKGKNVFAKFVVDADKNIRPGDEVLVVSEDGDLVAVGSSRLSATELIELESGLAVKVKDFKENYKDLEKILDLGED
ncbi:MAG: tRNA guanosine(15) transglycosylase TgtA [Thermoplasmata archaeon]|nr:MAG: tRNA guanosine(15) transglycosylase TgtA [Thermoplasmata archaeon]